MLKEKYIAFRKKKYNYFLVIFFIYSFAYSYNNYISSQRPIFELLKWEEINNSNIFLPKVGPFYDDSSSTYTSSFYINNYKNYKSIFFKQIFSEINFNTIDTSRLRLYGSVLVKLNNRLNIQNEFEFDNKGKNDIHFIGIERGAKNGWVGYLQHSTLTYNYLKGYISLGKGNPYLYNFNESLLINPYIPPVKYLLWKHKADWLEYDWVFILLNDSKITNNNRFLTVHRYGIATQNWRIGFTESVLAEYEILGANELEYLLPSNVLLESEANSKYNTNLTWLFDAMMKLNDWTIYSEIFIDDFAIDGKSPPQIAGIIGFGKKIQKFLFNVEYVRINRWVGNHCDEKIIFIDNDVPIGHSLGPDAHKFLIDSFIIINKKLTINFQANYIEHALGEAKERLVEVWPNVNSCDENFGSGNKDYFLNNKSTDYYLFSKVNYHINNQILINLFLDSNLDANLNITLKF